MFGKFSPLTQEIDAVLHLGDGDIGSTHWNRRHRMVAVGQVGLRKDSGDWSTNHVSTTHCSVVHVGPDEHPAAVDCLQVDYLISNRVSERKE